MARSLAKAQQLSAASTCIPASKLRWSRRGG
jgi:hypothetical protein